MKYDIIETATAALMSKTPTIIVEGLDDIKFYGNLCTLIDLNVNIQAIETIDGYSEGCEQVLKAIEDLQDEIVKNSILIKYMLGIIDRDARYYRNDIPDIYCLFVLNCYSYECHLLTRYSLKKVISIMTRFDEINIKDTVIDFVLSGIAEYYEKLYYISLEALKFSCDPTYKAVVAYSKKAGSILDQGSLNYIWPQIELKKDELDAFACKHSITMGDLKFIAKGKWLLHLWCNHVLWKIKELKNNCGTNIPKCSFCISGKNGKCLWKVETCYKIPQIISILCSVDTLDLSELSYICERFKLLSSC